MKPTLPDTISKKNYLFFIKYKNEIEEYDKIKANKFNDGINKNFKNMYFNFLNYRNFITNFINFFINNRK